MVKCVAYYSVMSLCKHYFPVNSVVYEAHNVQLTLCLYSSIGQCHLQILGSQLKPAIEITSKNLERKIYVKMTFHGYVINERCKRLLNAQWSMI